MKKYLIFMLIVATALQLKAQFVTKLSSDQYTLTCGDSAHLYLKTVPEKYDFYTPMPFYQIYFYNSEIGYTIGGGGIILKTTDGGKSWSDKTFNPLINMDSWHTISFTTADTGFILSSNCILYKTTNGGETWELKSNYTDCSCIKFFNKNTGFMLGNSGIIKKTTDGGENWYIVPSGTNALFKDIAFINDTTGYIVGYQDNYQNTLLRTTDGGETWAKASTPNKLYDMLDITFYNDKLGYIHANDILKTTDGGLSWTAIENLCYSPVISWDENTSFYTNNKMWILSSDNSSQEFFYTDCPVFYMAGPDHQSLHFVTCQSEIYRYIKPVSYQWEPSAGLSANDIPNPVATPFITTTYKVRVEAADGEVRYDSITIHVDRSFYSPEICKITADSLSLHNQIIWNSPGTNIADSVYLYKEGNVSNQFNKIGSFTASQPGSFIDQESDITVKSERYELSILDKCAFESDRGLAHKSVHLSINQGINNTWNLIWELYEGVSVYSYNIYRGSAAGALQLLATVSGTTSQYTDNHADSVNIYYQIEALLSSYCDSLKSSNSSFSNIIDRHTSPHGISQKEADANFKIVSNPVSDHFSVETDHFSEISGVAVISANGKELRNWSNPSKNKFDISDLHSGIYLLKIEFGKNRQTAIRKLIKL